jgi:hypothetical protein
MPGLRVLDQHVITGTERIKAKSAIGGDVAALTVAFGTRAPVADGIWDRKVGGCATLQLGSFSWGLVGDATDRLGGVCLVGPCPRCALVATCSRTLPLTLRPKA